MIYLIKYRNYLEGATALKFVELGAAEAALKSLTEKDGSIGGFIVADDSSLSDVSAKTLVTLYNLWKEDGANDIQKFENRTIAKQRFLARLEAKFRDQPVVEAPVSNNPGASGEPAAPHQEADMAEKSSKKKEKKAAKKEPRVIGKPAGLVSNFSQVRDGTDRQKILKLMNGTKTPAQIAAAVGKDEKYVLTAAYCINRDCGIGYGMTDDGKLEATYPGSKTYEDAIKKADKAAA